MAEVTTLFDDCTLTVGPSSPMAFDINSYIHDENGDQLYSQAGRMTYGEAQMWLSGFIRGNAQGYARGRTDQAKLTSDALKQLINPEL